MPQPVPQTCPLLLLCLAALLFGSACAASDDPVKTQEGAQQMRFTLYNDTPRPLWVYDEAASWLTVSRQDEALRLPDGCDPPCEEGEGVAPGSCARPAPVPVELAPGESRSFQWDGAHLQEHSSGGVQCVTTRYTVRGEDLNAKFCWGVYGADGPLADPRCETLAFRSGFDVTHWIRGE